MVLKPHNTFVCLALCCSKVLVNRYIPCWTRLLPESPRWLLLKKGAKPTLEVVRKVAKVNKISLPPSWKSALEKSSETREAEVKSSHIVRQLVQHPKLLIRTIIIFFSWWVVYILVSSSSALVVNNSHVHSLFWTSGLFSVRPFLVKN